MTDRNGMDEWQDKENDRLRALGSAQDASGQLLALFEDHYWDSLEKDKDIVLLHVKSVLRAASQGAFAGSDIASDERDVSGHAEIQRSEPGKAGVDGSIPSRSTIQNAADLLQVELDKLDAPITYTACMALSEKLAAALRTPAESKPLSWEQVGWLRDYDVEGEEVTEICDEGDPGAYAIYRLTETNTQLVEQVEDASACAQFVKWALQEGPWQGGDLDGGSIQDKAEELCLIQKVPYDPKKHGESEFGAEPGDDWYVLSDAVAGLSNSSTVIGGGK
ncbi:hypothetical protein [Bradyrhizobium stylosanthis]|uniref:Uncharacterized protein n=1 Tax=Bradyrhizobium stylosanthis TaxID=1803665 RepID=A0A560CXH8_9BRAD|nr:hypothetical protein [Bradyrhizobium stylosanthis]TWA89555.1 hypothetical protein FBZ96_11923 [Bradyrhizobium stylosanthis]